MQTRRKGKKGKSTKPKEYTGPRILSPEENTHNFSDYLQKGNTKEYIEFVLSEKNTSNERKQLLQARAQINQHQDLINNIIKYERISAKHGRYWKDGLKKLQDASNQLNQMDLSNEQLTKEQIYQANQIFTAYNFAISQVFNEIFEKDPSSINTRYINQGKLNKQDIKQLFAFITQIDYASTSIFGTQIRSKGIKSVLGKYVPLSRSDFMERHEKQHQQYQDARSKKVDYSPVFRTQNSNRRYGNQFVSEEDINRTWARNRAEIDQTPQWMITLQLNRFWGQLGLKESKATDPEAVRQALETYWDRINGVEEIQNKKLREAQIQSALAGFWYQRDLFELTGSNELYIEPYMIKALQQQIEDKILKNQLVSSLLSVNTQILSAQQAFLDILSGVTQAVSSGFQDIAGTIDSIVDLPVKQVVQVMNIATKSLVAVGKGTQKQVDLFQNATYNITSASKKKKDKDDTSLYDEAVQSVTQIAQTIFDIISQILKVFAQGIQLVQGVVSMGIQFFITMFSAILKILKKILSTSKTIDQIQNILNLALSVFLLPAILVFGDGIFKQVLKFISWLNAEDGGQALFQTASSFAELQEPINALFEQIKNLTPSFTEVIYDVLKQLGTIFQETIQPVIKAFQLFLSSDKGEASELISLCEYGIKVAQKLLDAGIMDLFLRAGIQGLQFIYDNKEELFRALDVSWDWLSMQLDFMVFCSDHMVELCMTVGGAIGALVGFIGNLLFTVGGISGLAQLIRLFGPRIAQVQGMETALTKSGLLSIVLGGASGSAIGLFIATEYFSFQEGGYIPPTPGGRLIRVAEKETEYIIPESKIHLIRGHNNLVIEINGDVYGIDQKRDILDAINLVSNRQRFR